MIYADKLICKLKIRKNLVFALVLIICIILFLFFQYINAWNAWRGMVNIQINFDDLSYKEQSDIISKSNWCFSNNECIEEIEYIRYGNEVEEVIIKIRTEDVIQFVSNNEDISSIFLSIDPSELATGETGYYSNGNMLYIAIQVREYTHMGNNDKNTYIADLLETVLTVVKRQQG
ncbi:MAG: hypothetical protein K2K44_10935 [Oscillospiraceae bacterium]|nr:hypothetical protein [Oscillospiraceae bacterium]